MNKRSLIKIGILVEKQQVTRPNKKLTPSIRPNKELVPNRRPNRELVSNIRPNRDIAIRSIRKVSTRISFKNFRSLKRLRRFWNFSVVALQSLKV